MTVNNPSEKDVKKSSLTVSLETQKALTNIYEQVRANMEKNTKITWKSASEQCELGSFLCLIDKIQKNN